MHKYLPTNFKLLRVVALFESDWNGANRFDITCHNITLCSIATGNCFAQYSVFIGEADGEAVEF
ncbi:hypothetical protein D3C81_1351590 [compost metagenome]